MCRHLTGGIVGSVLILLAPLTASAECGSLPLRTFTVEERQQLETQHGVNWWRAMGLIPGPQTAADYVERPFGDSSITVYIPQQFWDPRGCAASPDPPARPRESREKEQSAPGP
jgi:hypothetical protein